MTEYPKSTGEAPQEEKAEAQEMLFPIAFATLYYKGIEMLADFQKSTLDMYGRQTADAIKSFKQTFPAAPFGPGMVFVDVASQGLGRIIDMQKGMVDLMVRQSAVGIEGLKQRNASASKAAGGVTNLVRDAANFSVATQKIALDFAAQQNRAVTDAVKRQAGVSGTPVSAAADSIQRGVNAMIETHKELLDIAVKATGE
jgi:hypothetical protein